MNREKNALIATTPQLNAFLRDCASNAAEIFFAEALIPGEVYRSVCANPENINKLVGCLRTRVELNRNNLVKILKILIELPGSEDLVKTLRSNYYDKYHGTLELPGGEAEIMDPADERNIGGVEPIHDGSNLTTLNIKRILMDGDFPAGEAEELGTFLGVESGKISTLRTNSNGNAYKLLTAIIEEWLRNDKKKSWEKLADAVRSCRHSLLADKILKQYCGVKRKVFQKQHQQQESSILTTPLEKMGLTEGSNIHKRSVISNGGDKEEVDIAESSEKHEDKEGKSGQLLPSVYTCVLILILGIIGISILWTFL